MADANPLVVIGHKNPDTDTICSALAYAQYKREVDNTPAVAFRAGNLNAQTRHVLEEFDTEIPEFLSDVYPRVRDIMIPKRELFLIGPSDPIAGARKMILANRSASCRSQMNPAGALASSPHWDWRVSWTRSIHSPVLR